MVKLSGVKADQWLANPDTTYWAALLYGPNYGLVSIRIRALIKFFSGGKISDPFAVACIDDDRLRANPSAIRDEAFSQSLIGTERVVWIRNIAEKSADEFRLILEATVKPNTLLIEAGDLSPRSKIRHFFERANNVISIGCYEDDAQVIQELVRGRFRELNITADRNAMDALLARLGKDRLRNISEIEKVCLYAGQDGVLSEEAILLLVGEGGALSRNELMFAIFNGQRNLADNLLRTSINDGLLPIQFIRQLQTHVERLLAVQAAVNQGATPEQAISKLRPPVFFKFRKSFHQQVNVWPATLLRKCFDVLIKLEIECKTTGMPDIALCQRMSLSVSGLAHKLAQKQQ